MVRIAKIVARTFPEHIIHRSNHRQKSPFNISPDIKMDTEREKAPVMPSDPDNQSIPSPDKIKEKVRGMEVEFQNFINNGTRMFCFGQQCLHCFLRGFCRDILELKRIRILWSKPGPVCLRKTSSPKESFNFNDKFDLYEFMDFYIRCRYYLKSPRCRACIHNSICQGIQVKKTIKRGFGMLKPASPMTIKPNESHYVYLFADACDFKCIFCEERKPWTKSIAEVRKDFIGFYGKGIRKITFGGTEPLNHPEILEIVKMAGKYFSSIQLCTASDKLTDRGFVTQIITSKITNIDLAIYGASARVHDSIVGKTGAFNNLMKSLANLEKKKVQLVLHTLLLKENIRELTELFELLQERYPWVKFSIAGLRPTFNGRVNYGELVPKLSAVRKSITTIKRSLKQAKRGRNAKIKFENIPLCAIVNTAREAAERSFFDYSFSQNREFEWCDSSDKCSGCSIYKNACPGLPQEYFNLFGDAEVAPVIDFDKKRG